RGEARMESVAPLRSVLTLAHEAQAHSEVASLLRSRRPDEEIWTQIMVTPGAATFRAMAFEHVRVHGHRVIDELKFEARSLHEAPWMLVGIVRNYVGLGLEPETMALRGRERRAEAEREFRRRFRHAPLRGLLARWILESARRTLTDRENLALVRTRSHALLRDRKSTRLNS